MMDYRQSSNVNGTSYNMLDSSIRDILSLIKPLEEDRLRRLNTINDVRNVIQSVTSLKGATVNPFGSYISNLHTKWGDLDISIQVSLRLHSSIGKRRKQTLLREVMMAFRRAGCGQIRFIPHARVPLLIYEHSSQNISCDISIDNYVGVIKSKIFLWITEIDERFRDMVLLIKEWAKVHDINDPKAGTLNSYSLCLLVIFHFQTCKPPILPPLKDIYGGNLVHDFPGILAFSERQIEDLCISNIAKFRSLVRKNTSTLYELLRSFFQKFSSIRELATYSAICTYSGTWESISSKLDWSGKSYKLIVEDPFEQPENAARAIGETGLTKVSNAFAETSRRLSSFTVLSNKKDLLSILVRPHVIHVATAPRLHQGNVGTQGHESRTVTNRAAAPNPPVQTRFATSGVSRPVTNYAAARYPPVQTRTATSSVSRTVTNYAAARSPPVQTRTATSGVSRTVTNYAAARSPPVQTRTATSGVLQQGQFRDNWSSSPSSSSQSYRGAREAQIGAMWIQRHY